MKQTLVFIFFVIAVFFSACDHFDDPALPEINDCTLTIVNHDGVAMSNVWAKLYYTDIKTDFVVDSAYTSVLGKTSFRSLAPRTYTMKAFNLNDEELGSTQITIGKDNTGNDIEWVIDVYIENYNFTVWLVDHLQNPIEGRKVGLYTADKTLIKEGFSDATGKVVFSHSVVGDYNVIVYDPENEIVLAETAFSLNAASTSKTFELRRIYHNTDIVITGFLSDPRGSDSPVTGAVSGDGFVHPGQYEYVQLMALRDIDFSLENYSVVFTNSSVVSSWGHGIYFPTDKRNYQMNLTTGSVKKGQYFYVGGNSRMICSYYKLIGSPQLSTSVFWGIDYSAETGGNNNGAAKAGSGLLGNGTGTAGLLAVSKAYPDGIGVFEGTQVDENTIPVDAIFFGSTANFNTDAVKLQIPDNDRYNRADLETGDPQPIFGVGSNTYLFPVPATDKGVFIKLGGQVTPDEWLIPRTGTPILFNMLDTPGASVADIENAADCTLFINR